MLILRQRRPVHGDAVSSVEPVVIHRLTDPLLTQQPPRHADGFAETVGPFLVGDEMVTPHALQREFAADRVLVDVVAGEDGGGISPPGVAEGVFYGLAGVAVYGEVHREPY